ncbi:Hypothetical protein, putative [Bodo saltans]|uniref:Uncharacterized protein n=1 Tax=Bodo saltans TaxID=75058 RepID=A0A0S4J5A4_BODSA|nr:Hypothetical protein, putative [Bodo saltans]|eukprot:CUG83080.1 Hypothetical protein, putative [Bodo saltans]
MPAVHSVPLNTRARVISAPIHSTYWIHDLYAPSFSRSCTHTLLASACDNNVKFVVARVSEGESKREDLQQRHPMTFHVTPTGYIINHRHGSHNSTTLSVHIEVPLPNSDVATYEANIYREAINATMMLSAPAMRLNSELDPDHKHEVLRALAAIGAFFGITTGGEKWIGVDKKKPLCPIPFSIGRKAIVVKDGSEVVATYQSRGRDDNYTAKLEILPTSEGTVRAVATIGRVSHPQLPMLREIVANAVSGVMRFSGARWKWGKHDGVPDVGPRCMTINELDDAPTVSMPEIYVGIVPVKPTPVKKPE